MLWSMLQSILAVIIPLVDLNSLASSLFSFNSTKNVSIFLLFNVFCLKYLKCLVKTLQYNSFIQM